MDILGLFWPFSGKNEKMDLSVLDFTISYHHTKKSKNTNEQSPEENPKLTDRQKDCDFVGDFDGVSIYGGPK